MSTESVANGSKSVMTININQVIQDAVNANIRQINDATVPETNAAHYYLNYKKDIKDAMLASIKSITERVHKYQTSFNEIIKDFYNNNMLDIYSAGFIDLRKQYLTIG